MKRLFILLFFLLVGCAAPVTTTPYIDVTTTLVPTHAATPTKATLCILNGPYPDPTCTPGDVLPVTKEEICKSGYSAATRDVDEELKDTVYLEYGITKHTSGQYEVDHFIPLELGGSNKITNLFPEAAQPVPGFHEKDEVENYLHAEVCEGRIDLANAQKDIRTDWVAVYYLIPTATITPTQSSKHSGKCVDGTYTDAQNRQGACSHHGGVKEWYK